MKQTELRRRRLYRPPRPEPFPTDLHAAVLARDRMCVAAKLWPDHECRTAFGRPHMPDDLALLTLEHVKESIGMVPRTHDLAHIIALCGALNLQPPTKEQREAFRAYLASVNG